MKKRKKWLPIVIVLAMIAIIIGIAGNDTEKIVWDDIALGDIVPNPNGKKGKIYSNDDDYLSIYAHKISKSDYNAYVDVCVEAGFTVEANKDEDSYNAYNQDGYELSLSYNESKKIMNLSCNAPEEMTEIKWPTNGVGSKLPKPKSTKGNVQSDSSELYSVHIADMTKDDYNDYVEQCKNAGFDVDYNKIETYFSAENKDGYSISVDYIGFNVIGISIDAPENLSVEETDEEITVDEEETIEEKESEKAETEEATTEKEESDLIDGLRPDFKDAMDSYEEFMLDYVDFMDEYKESNGTDLGLIADYADMMDKYSECVEDFEKWENEDMNTAEAAYYLKVQTRINEKLAEVAY